MRDAVNMLTVAARVLWYPSFHSDRGGGLHMSFDKGALHGSRFGVHFLGLLNPKL